MSEPKLRVWWIPQIPMKAFHVPVRTLREAKLLLDTLAQYDLFQFDNRVKPDYSNAGGLQIWENIDGVADWNDWEHPEDGSGIDAISMAEADALDALTEAQWFAPTEGREK